MAKETLLLDEVIESLGNAGVDYRYSEFTTGIAFKFDSSYFGKFIRTTLFENFVSSIYHKIQPLNNFEAGRFLNLSVIQFQVFNLEKGREIFIEDYCGSKWFPIINVDKENNLDEKYANHVWGNFQMYFHLFKDAVEKTLVDFKAGLLGSQPAQNVSIPTIQNNIVYKSFDAFLNCLKYNYPYKNTVWSFKHEMIEALDLFKKEIYTNLIALNKDEKKAYLNRLKYDLANHQQHVWSSADTLEKWYKKYDSPQENDIFFNISDNIIYQILNSDKPTSKEENNEAFNEDTEQIQDEFYNFYYGFYLDNAITFIVEQINELIPFQSLLTNGSQPQQPLNTTTSKLKVNITVPQLVYLFKMLNDVKPQIFDIEAKTELSNFIAANFITKATEKEGIKTKSVYNLFSDTDKKVANYWVDILRKMLEDARKI